MLISQGDGRIIVWDWANGSALKTLDGWGRLSLDPSGQRAITGWYDSATAGTIVRTFDLTQTGSPRDIRPRFVQTNLLDLTIGTALVHDGSEILVLGSNGAEWWDAEGSKMEGHTDVLRLITEETGAVSPIGAVTPDGFVLTEPGIGLAVPGIAFPIPSYGTPTCGFALWDPTELGACIMPGGSDGCPTSPVIGDADEW